MHVRAKFQFHSVVPTPYSGDGKIVNASAVYGGGEANKEWAKATPNFTQGQYLFLDISDAPADG